MSKINFVKDKIPFTQVANEVLNDPDLSAKAKGLYAYLYSKPDGWDFALDRISNDFSDGRRSIYTGILELEKKGYLKREKIMGNAENKGRTKYHLLSKIDSKPVVDFSNDEFQQRCKIDSISNKDIKKIKNIKNKDNMLFDIFWNLYPVKKQKKLAETKWKKLDQSTQQNILSDVQNRLQNDDQWQRGYIPYPATYFNQERWNDDVSKPKVGNMKSFSVID